MSDPKIRLRGDIVKSRGASVAECVFIVRTGEFVNTYISEYTSDLCRTSNSEVFVSQSISAVAPVQISCLGNISHPARTAAASDDEISIILQAFREQAVLQ